MVHVVRTFWYQYHWYVRTYTGSVTYVHMYLPWYMCTYHGTIHSTPAMVVYVYHWYHWYNNTNW
jgi:hypothetical protein